MSSIFKKPEEKIIYSSVNFPENWFVSFAENDNQDDLFSKGKLFISHPIFNCEIEKRESRSQVYFNCNSNLITDPECLWDHFMKIVEKQKLEELEERKKMLILDIGAFDEA